MTVRHAVLPIGAVLVLGLGVYLLIAVRSEPAPLIAARPPSAAAPSASAQVEDAVATLPAPPVAPPPADGAEPARHRAAAASPASPASAVPSSAPAEPDAMLAGPKLDAVMGEANKAYDRGDLEEAKTIASRVLARLPTNVRMLRIMVSASCIDGDSAVAQAHFAKLPPGDQEQMKVRCARYGMTFQDTP